MTATPFLILETLGGSRVPLSDPTTFGRATDNSVSLKDASVSSHHAAIHKDGAFWVVEDLGSTNGTWLNHKRVDGTAVIKEGDQIQMGSQMIRVSGFRGTVDRRAPAALCPRCENPLPSGAAYCPSCGLAQGGAAAPPLPAAGPTTSGSRPVSTAPFAVPYPNGTSAPLAPAPSKRPNWMVLGCLAGVVLAILSLLAGWWLWNGLKSRFPERPGASTRV
jgi:hypothetical protein